MDEEKFFSLVWRTAVAIKGGIFSKGGYFSAYVARHFLENPGSTASRNIFFERAGSGDIFAMRTKSILSGETVSLFFGRTIREIKRDCVDFIFYELGVSSLEELELKLESEGF